MTKSLNAALTADVVLFAPRDNGLHVLLIQRRNPPFKGCWALPGGYVDEDETTSAGARRELAEETGIEVTFLQQVGIYDALGRDPRGRVVSVAFSALLTEAPEPTAADDAAAARWVSVDEVIKEPSRLAFDHFQIVVDALNRTGLSSVRRVSEVIQ